MNASVRMVCGGCLRSVEMSSGAAGQRGESMSLLWRSDRQPFQPDAITRRGRRGVDGDDPGGRDGRRRDERLGQDLGAGLAGLAWADFNCGNGWAMAVSARYFGPTIPGSTATWR